MKPGAPRTAVCVAYHVGSKNERSGLTGFAHFFEHMMFRGTQHVPNFDVPLQAAGGSPNAFTSEDVTVYFETIPNNYLERALYMEANRMAFLSTALDQEKFDTEREVVKNERRQRMENAPYGLASETLSAAVYPKGHPYSWSVIGSMDDLNRATLDDPEAVLLRILPPWKRNADLVWAVFDPEEAKTLIERYFGPLSAGSDIPPVIAPATPGPSKTHCPEGPCAVPTCLSRLAHRQGNLRGRGRFGPAVIDSVRGVTHHDSRRPSCATSSWQSK